MSTPSTTPSQRRPATSAGKRIASPSITSPSSISHRDLSSRQDKIIDSYRVQLSRARKTNLRLQRKLEEDTKLDSLIESRNLITSLEAQIKEKDEVIRGLKHQVFEKDRAMRHVMSRDQDGLSAQERAQRRATAASALADSKAKEMDALRARLTELERREVVAQTAMGQVYFTLMKGEDAEDAARKLEEAYGALRRRLQASTRDNGALQTRVDGLEALVAKLERKLVVSEKARESDKRLADSRVRQAQAQSSELQEQLLSFATEYDSLAREYKNEMRTDDGMDVEGMDVEDMEDDGLLEGIGMSSDAIEEDAAVDLEAPAVVLEEDVGEETSEDLAGVF
eukprot:gnl/Dysnectes_brevis/2234_a2610_1926.p1 GENE.gnl/Dysnectes_brevis/2234_a2610_1926~~gnl/Dysnectes_brevis/2234_a2610_1926.p1  ORF type:complete len:356 (-),score=124.88 gnl/Dysnectes_brevis/2234_a2610_1926:163-1179(-)